MVPDESMGAVDYVLTALGCRAVPQIATPPLDPSAPVQPDFTYFSRRYLLPCTEAVLASVSPNTFLDSFAALP